MYSRNRMAPEEKYTGNIPPLYSGNRFSYPRRERSEGEYTQAEKTEMPPLPLAEPAEPMVEATSADGGLPDAPAEKLPGRPPRPGGILEIGQEELLLIALLLLLSAEHERSMDIIVVLLLLIGIH